GHAVKLLATADVDPSRVWRTIVCIREPHGTIASHQRLIMPVEVAEGSRRFDQTDRALHRSAGIYKISMAAMILNPSIDPLFVDYSAWAHPDATIARIAAYLGSRARPLDIEFRYKPPTIQSDDSDAIALCDAVRSQSFSPAVLQLAQSIGRRM